MPGRMRRAAAALLLLALGGLSTACGGNEASAPAAVPAASAPAGTSADAGPQRPSETSPAHTAPAPPATMTEDVVPAPKAKAPRRANDVNPADVALARAAILRKGDLTAGWTLSKPDQAGPTSGAERIKPDPDEKACGFVDGGRTESVERVATRKGRTFTLFMNASASVYASEAAARRDHEALYGGDGKVLRCLLRLASADLGGKVFHETFEPIPVPASCVLVEGLAYGWRAVGDGKRFSAAVVVVSFRIRRTNVDIFALTIGTPPAAAAKGLRKAATRIGAHVTARVIAADTAVHATPWGCHRPASARGGA